MSYTNFKFIDKIAPETLLQQALENIRKGFSLGKTISFLAKRYGVEDTEMYNRLRTFRSEIDRVLEEVEANKEGLRLERQSKVMVRNLDSVIKFLEENKENLVMDDDQELIELEKEEERLTNILHNIESFLEANRPIQKLQAEVEELRVTYRTLDRLGLLKGGDTELV